MGDECLDIMECEMSSPALPQEIIHQVLSNIPTRKLCQMLSTSRSFYLDVMGILNARLQRKLVDEGDNKLIFEAFLPSDMRSVPYHLSTYTHTSPENPAFTSTLYSYFSLTSSEETPAWPGRFGVPIPPKATYSFSLAADDPWAQLALQGNLVKISPNRPGMFRATVPCFERRDFVRLKADRLNLLAGSGEGEMIWINDKREVGVFTQVIGKKVDDERRRSVNQGVPTYIKPREGTVRFTLGFEYLAMKTGFLVAKLEDLDRNDRNTLAIIWRGPNQGEL